MLKPFVATEKEHIFFEGDEIVGMYFLKEGSLGFVLPKHKNTEYIEIGEGNYFGAIDIVGSILQHQDCLTEDDDIFNHKEKLIRQFTIMSDNISEILMLELNDLNRMKIEFMECYDAIM